MSKENVEIVRRGYEALHQGEYTAFFEALDPEIELVLPEGGMNAGTHRGAPWVRQFLEGYFESFENFRPRLDAARRQGTTRGGLPGPRKTGRARSRRAGLALDSIAIGVARQA
jgi:ketosteroid isomerase-like protein